MTNLTIDVRPAKTTHTISSMSASTAAAVDMARLHLRRGHAGAYARVLAGQHRAGSLRQQKAIEAVIAADACDRLFTRHPSNGCLLAREA